jgi:hypothetical protein
MSALLCHMAEGLESVSVMTSDIIWVRREFLLLDVIFNLVLHLQENLLAGGTCCGCVLLAVSELMRCRAIQQEWVPSTRHQEVAIGLFYMLWEHPALPFKEDQQLVRERSAGNGLSSLNGWVRHSPLTTYWHSSPVWRTCTRKPVLQWLSSHERVCTAPYAVCAELRQNLYMNQLAVSISFLFLCLSRLILFVQLLLMRPPNCSDCEWPYNLLLFTGLQLQMVSRQTVLASGSKGSHLLLWNLHPELHWTCGIGEPPCLAWTNWDLCTQWAMRLECEADHSPHLI